MPAAPASRIERMVRGELVMMRFLAARRNAHAEISLSSNPAQ
jgi:hypothetical protein